jgi:hypothetical protein
MRAPTAADSRVVKPVSLAAAAQAMNLEKNANAQIRMTYPQIVPVLSRPKFVLRPDRTKYCRNVSR